MKRILSAALCAVTLFSLLLTPVRAAGEPSAAYRVAAELGVVRVGQNEPGRSISRGEFAKMLVAASPLKGTVSPTGNASPYRDVPYTHPYASYIKTAVSKGWMSGHLDGTFRPDRAVNTAEASTAVLALLGYGSADFSGSYPEGQLALYQTLGLSRGISAGAKGGLNEGDCVNLFYNLLGVKTKDGEKKYAEVLGYKLDKDGKPDVEALLRAPTEGPVVVTAQGWQKAISFTPVMVYRNDAKAGVGELQPWDVLYYSVGKQTVWAYARRASGTLEKISPSREAPESVTVAGREYKVSGELIKTQLGPSGGLSMGSVVTLLLGREGEAAGAYAAESLLTEIMGVVTTVKTASYTASNGSTFEAPALTLMGLDGQTYTVRSTQKYKVGDVVRVSFSAAGTKVTRLAGNRGLSGKVNAKAGKIGNTTVAPEVQILDVREGAAVKIYLSRLDGMTLTGEQVMYSQKNAAGAVTALVLNGVTGDQNSYGIVLSAQETGQGMNMSGTYRVLVGGEEITTHTTDRILNAKLGPARIVMKDGQVASVRSLSELKNVESITGMTLKAGGESHIIWDHAQAFIFAGGQYRQVDRNELDPAQYKITAYCDASASQGGRVRILTAIPR